MAKGDDKMGETYRVDPQSEAPTVIPAEAHEMSEEDSQAAHEEKRAFVKRLGLSLRQLRDEAIRGRAASGIEAEWLKDEEYYEGIDDLNRSERSSAMRKPEGQYAVERRESTGSTVFINITRPYVDGAAARLADILLPSNDRAWAYEVTPVSELIPIAKGQTPKRLKARIEDAQRDPVTDEINQEGVAKTEEELRQFALQELKKAKAAVDKATTRVEDWHEECQFQAELRKAIEDCAKVGSGVIKGPIPEKKRAVAFIDGRIVIQDEIKPVSKQISYWNFYPDPSCGHNIHDGNYVWERDDITQKALVGLIGVPGYDADSIHEVLEEGPHTAVTLQANQSQENPMLNGLSAINGRSLYEIWYYYGTLSAKVLEHLGCECPEGTNIVDVQLTMVNNHVIKAALNPLETGDFPYDLVTWQRRRGVCWGAGVASQVRTPQRIITAATRSMMDNAGRAGGPQVILQQGVVQPADGVYCIEPWKVWVADEQADTQGLNNAFRFVTIDMYQQQFQGIIELGLRLAEDVTGMPMIMQGQTNVNTPTTFSGMQLQNNNASTILRRTVRLFDDTFSVPHMQRWYRWLLMYGEDDEKGDFQIVARGSSALIEKDMHTQELMQLGDIVQNPVFGLDPKKWLRKYLKAKRVDVRDLEYDDEEWKKIVESMANPPQQPDPSVEVARIKQETDIKVAEINSGNRDKDRESREQIAAHNMANSVREVELTRESKEQIAAHTMAQKQALEQGRLEMQRAIEEMRQQIALVKADKEDARHLDSIKESMAKLVMTLDAQKELSQMNGGQAARPAAEPPQRAQPGRGFEQ